MSEAVIDQNDTAMSFDPPTVSAAEFSRPTDPAPPTRTTTTTTTTTSDNTQVGESNLAPSVTPASTGPKVIESAPLTVPVTSTGPSVSFVFGGSKKSPTLSNHTGMSFQPIAPAPQAQSTSTAASINPVDSESSSATRKRKRTSTAEQQLQQQQALQFRRTSARHRSYEEPSASLAATSHGTESAATDFASSRRINYAESSEDTGAGDESDGDPPGMSSTAKDTDYDPRADRILDVKREAGGGNGTAGADGHSRHYSELEDINYSVPKLFTSLVAEIAAARGDNLYVRDDSTGKVASAYMHVVCAYRSSGCPFILKLTKAKEGGWTLKSAGLPQPGEADPKARSNYSCIHLPDAVPGQIPAMPAPGEGFLPGEGFAKKPAPPRKKPPPPRNHSQSLSPAQGFTAIRRTSRPISSTRPFDPSSGSAGSYTANVDSPASLPANGSTGVGFAPPYQPSSQSTSGSAPGVSGTPSSSSVKYRSSMGSSNFQTGQDLATQSPGDDRALAPPFKRSLHLAQQIVPVLSQSAHGQASASDTSKSASAPTLTTFPQQAGTGQSSSSRSRPGEPTRSKSRSGHRHHGDDHTYCCTHACPYERIVVAHLLAATVTQPGASMSIMHEVQNGAQSQPGATVHVSPTESIFDQPRLSHSNDWHAFFQVYDDEALSPLAEILSSPVFGVTPKTFFASSRQIQLAFVDLLAQSPTVPIFPRLQLRERILSGAIQLAWIELERATITGDFAKDWDEQAELRKETVEQIKVLQDKLQEIETKAGALQAEQLSRYRVALVKAAAQQRTIFINGHGPADSSATKGKGKASVPPTEGSAGKDVDINMENDATASVASAPSTLFAPSANAPRAPSPLGITSSTAIPPFVIPRPVVALESNGIDANSNVTSSEQPTAPASANGAGAPIPDEDAEMDFYKTDDAAHAQTPVLGRESDQGQARTQVTTQVATDAPSMAARRKSSEHGIPGLSPPGSPAAASTSPRPIMIKIKPN